VPEAGCGFCPLGVIWVLGDFCAAAILVSKSLGWGGRRWYFLGPARPIVRFVWGRSGSRIGGDKVFEVLRSEVRWQFLPRSQPYEIA